MVKCVVKSCLSRSEKDDKASGVTFHKVPKEQKRKEEWTRCIRLLRKETDWLPSTSTAICSKHFKDQDKIPPKHDRGHTKLTEQAVPMVIVSGLPQCTSLHDNMEMVNTSTEIKPEAIANFSTSLSICEGICRMCLRTDVDLYEMQECGLQEYYLQLTAVTPHAEPALPQAVCVYCAHLLRKFHKLRQSALLANDTLQNLLKEHGCVSKDILSTIDIKPSPFSLGPSAQTPNSVLPTEDVDPISYMAMTIKTDDMVKKEPLEDTFSNNNDDDDYSNVDPVDAFSGGRLSDVTSPELLQMDVVTEDGDTVNASMSVCCLDPVESNESTETAKKPEKLKCRRKRKPTGRRSNDDLLKRHFTLEELSPEEQRANVLKRKDSDNYLNSIHKCHFCFKGFCRQETFDLHMKKHTDAATYGNYQCPACMLRCRSHRVVRKHVLATHQNQYSCRTSGCSFVTLLRNSATQHISSHQGIKYECPHCDAVYEKSTTYLSHLRIAHPSDFVCDLCGYSFINLLGIRAHKNKAHRYTDQQIPADAPTCDLCDIKFVSDDALRTHQRISAKHKTEGENSRNERSGERPYRKPRNARSGGHRYVKNESPSPLPCEQCGEVLPTPRAYFYHFRKEHPGETRTQYPAGVDSMCEVCGVILQNDWVLRDHMRRHTSEATLKCSQCPKYFKTKLQRAGHVNMVHRVHENECGVCGKMIKHPRNLIRHMLLHKSERPYACTHCGQRFPTKDRKNYHYKHKHLGVPYVKKKMKLQPRSQDPSCVEAPGFPAAHETRRPKETKPL